MFREMRRNKQELSETQTLDLLRQGDLGVLAVTGDEGWPYAVPLNYIYMNGALYFHCAAQGHKLDAIRADSRVCLSVILRDDRLPEKFTTNFVSVTVFGRASVVTDETEKRAALTAIADRFGPEGDTAARDAEVGSTFSRVCILRLDPVHITGKQSRELAAGSGE